MLFLCLLTGTLHTGLLLFLAELLCLLHPKRMGGSGPSLWRRPFAGSRLSAFATNTANRLSGGCGSRLGGEIAVHTFRQWCFRHAGDPNKVVVKIDFQNAFNCIDRSVFFRGVAEFMPGLCRWVEWCHGASAHLVFGKHNLSSQSGLQQGDPLGPLLFSLALRPVATELVGLGRDGNAGRKLDLCFFYLDDGFLAGDLEIVSQALATFAQLCRACPALGLTLELSKSELVVLTSVERQDLHQHFPQELLIDSATGGL